MEDGPAVNMARTMLLIYNHDSLYLNECERNGSGLQQRIAGNKKGRRRLLNTSVHDLSFTLYPNPTSGNFFIEKTGNGKDEYSVSLFDYLGRKQIKAVLTKDITEIKTSAFGSGIYFYEIKNSIGTTEERGKVIVIYND